MGGLSTKHDVGGCSSLRHMVYANNGGGML